MRFAFLLSLALLASAAFVPSARAQDPYECMDELEEAELEARLSLVDRRLQAGKRGARAWWYGWQAIFGGVFAYQLASAIVSDPGSERWANTIGTVGAFLALAQMWVIPQPAAYAPQRYRRMPTDTRAQREAKLAYGLDRLQTAAARETLGRGPMAHALPILWSAVWATTLSVKFDDPGRVALLVVGGFVITQARIWTTPQRAIGDWDELRWTICEHRFVRPSHDRDTEGEPDEEGNIDAGELRPDVPDEIEGPRAHLAPFSLGAQLVLTF